MFFSASISLAFPTIQKLRTRQYRTRKLIYKEKHSSWKFVMKKLDPDAQFLHRPSIRRRSSADIITPFQKKVSVTQPVLGEHFLEFNNSDYIIRDSGKKQNLDKETIFDEGNKGNGLNSQLERDNLSRALKREGLGLDRLSLKDLLHRELTNEDLKCIYFTSVYIINNYFGMCGPKSEYPQNLLQYVNQLLPLPLKTKQDYSKKARKIKPPDYVLTLEIIEAKSLISTDVNCLSDPYCRIWMSDQEEETKRTSVKEKTLNPKWKECFDFPLNDIKSDVIHIEIWDKDPSGFTASIRQIRKIKGLKGCRQFCREFCRNLPVFGLTETDDFVAKVDLPVNEIYSEGFDSWVALKDKRNRSTDSELHMSAGFKTLRPKNTLNALKRHLLLLKVCLQQSLEDYKGSYLTIVHLEQLLPLSAATLLFQHIVQSSLTLYENILCTFIVFMYFMPKEVSLNYQFLYTITDESYEKKLISTDYGPGNCLEDLYMEAVNKVYEICKSVITKLHYIDFIEDENQCIEFEFVLKCADISHQIAGKKEFLWPVFRSEATIWFDELADKINNTNSDIKSDFLTKTLAFILSYHSAVDKVIRNVFPNKSYTQCAFEVLDSVLSENLKPHIATISEEFFKSTETVKELKLREALEIFLKIKDLKDYLTEITSIPESNIQLANFREWFGSNTIEGWFRYKEEIIIPQISNIINSDNLESKLEKQGSSVKLTANLIRKELVQLRNYVYHPKYPNFDIVFLEVLHSVNMKYSEFLMDLIYSRNILSNFQLTGMKRLCTMANNLWSLSVFVQKTISETVIAIPNDSFDTKFCLRITCSLICADICKEFERDIVNLIQSIVVANSRRKQKQAIKAYVNRVRQLFNEEAMPYMAFEIHLLFTREMVKTITKAVAFFNETYKITDKVTIFKKCRNLFIKTPSVELGLLEVLSDIENLCFVDNLGKLKPFLWDDDYKALKNDLHQSLKVS